MKAADKAVPEVHARGGGERAEPAELAKRCATARSFARCMRGKGIDMPDPKSAATAA